MRHAFEQVDQLLHGAEEKDVAASRSDDSGDRHAGSTNLTLAVCTEVLNARYRCAFQMTPSEGWSSRRRCAK